MAPVWKAKNFGFLEDRAAIADGLKQIGQFTLLYYKPKEHNLLL